MNNALIVFTKFAETDNSIDVAFDANGQSFVFSPRKDNRMLFTDCKTAFALDAKYPGNFTIFATYDGAAYKEQERPAKLSDVAAVITNCVTLDATKCAYESFRRFYPELQIYVVDNGSNDASAEYVKSLDGEHTTVMINPYNYGHGAAMHQAACVASAEGYRFLLALDSDTETRHGGFVELMLALLGNGYAIGKAYWTDEYGFVSNSARGVPYIHPATALYNLKQYSMLRPFILHGAPCINNMIDARLRNLKVVDFPVSDYVFHHGTVTVQAVKITDVNMAFLFAQRPPLVSFVVHYCDEGHALERCVNSILRQTDADYEIVPITGWDGLSKEKTTIARARGLYMYIVDASSVVVDDSIVATVRHIATHNLYPNIIIVKTLGIDGNVTPQVWQDETVLTYHNLIERRELWMTSTINYSGRWDRAETVADSFSRNDWPKRYWLDRVVVNE